MTCISIQIAKWVLALVRIRNKWCPEKQLKRTKVTWCSYTFAKTSWYCWILIKRTWKKALMKSQFNFSFEMLIFHLNQTWMFVTHQIVKTSNRVCVYVIWIRLLIHLWEYERQNTFTVSGGMIVYQKKNNNI